MSKEVNLTPQEKLYFDIRKAKGLIKPLEVSTFAKILKEINVKLPLHES